MTITNPAYLFFFIHQTSLFISNVVPFLFIIISTAVSNHRSIIVDVILWVLPAKPHPPGNSKQQEEGGHDDCRVGEREQELGGNLPNLDRRVVVVEAGPTGEEVDREAEHGGHGVADAHHAAPEGGRNAHEEAARSPEHSQRRQGREDARDQDDYDVHLHAQDL